MTASTKLAPAPADQATTPPANGATVSDTAVPPANPASTPAVAAPLVDAPSPRSRRFGYVAQSSPSELAANVDRAIQSITAEAGGGLPCGQAALAVRGLCDDLGGFLWPAPSFKLTAERVEAFLGAFETLVVFACRVGEPPPQPEAQFGGSTGLGEVRASPVAELCWVLFDVYKARQEEGVSLAGELLECLELAVESFGDDGGGFCQGRGAVLGMLAYHAPLLFGIDSAWTQKHLLAHLAAGDAYRTSTAKLLVVFTDGSTERFLDEVWPYVLGLSEDLEAVFGDDSGSRRWELRRLHLFAERAFENNDEETIAQIAGVLRVMPDTDRGKFIHALHRPFDDLTGYYEELSDRELHEILSDRFRTPELIRTFWPAEPQYQSEWTTTCFIDLIFDAGEHAGDIYEACRDFLVPLKNERYQYWLYHDLALTDKYAACVQANPAVMAGIIDRTTIENSLHIKELTELRQQLATMPSHLAAP